MEGRRLKCSTWCLKLYYTGNQNSKMVHHYGARVAHFISSSQGLKEIRQWPIIGCTSPMMIHQITPSVYYNQLLKHLDTQLNKPTNKNLLKVPKLLSQRIRKLYY